MGAETQRIPCSRSSQPSVSGIIFGSTERRPNHRSQSSADDRALLCHASRRVMRLKHPMTIRVKSHKDLSRFST